MIDWSALVVAIAVFSFSPVDSHFTAPFQRYSSSLSLLWLVRCFSFSFAVWCPAQFGVFSCLSILQRVDSFCR